MTNGGSSRRTAWRNMNLESYPTLSQSRPHERTSDRYAFIPTTRALGVLADRGWFPARVQEAGTRDAANKGFQKHVVRLREREVSVGEEFPEIVLINSHM